MIASLGTSAIAANAILNSISNIATVPGLGMSLAIITILEVAITIAIGNLVPRSMYVMGYWLPSGGALAIDYQKQVSEFALVQTLWCGLALVVVLVLGRRRWQVAGRLVHPPMPPAAASWKPNALLTIIASTPGTSPRLAMMMPIATTR